MTPKKDPKSVRFHPMLPKPPHNGLDRKGSEDGQPGKPECKVDAGYDSDADPDDLPPDAYHNQWRVHDRALEPDPARRKAERDMTAGWSDAFPVLRDGKGRAACHIEGLVRSREHYFNQPGPYCFAVSAAFVYLRRSGFSPELSIATLKTEWFRNNFGDLQAEFNRRHAAKRTVPPTRFDSEALTEIMHRLQKAQRAGKFASTYVPKAMKPNHIWHYRFIGTYGISAGYQRKAHNNQVRQSNAVKEHVNLPRIRRPLTLQQALFSGYQPPRKIGVPDKPFRTVTPFVYIELGMPILGIVQAHSVIADFSDPLHPGIFDPNFGWLALQQGFNFLTFEVALNMIFEFYTLHNFFNPMKGIRFHRPLPGDIYVEAHQLIETAGA